MEHKELVIIGGGPARLAAGIYASWGAMDVVLLESLMTGGLILSTENIDNYPGYAKGIGSDVLVAEMEEQASRFGLEIRLVEVESLKRQDGKYLIEGPDTQILADAVILATGAKPRLLDVLGEREFTGRGVSYCATCDGAYFPDKILAVVGGGDAAVEEAFYLTRFARKVIIIHRRDQLWAAKGIQKKAFENEKIEVRWNYVVEEIQGTNGVETLLLKNTITQETDLLEVEGVFIYVGNNPSYEIVEGLVDLDEQGYIFSTEDMATSSPGLFVAGDVRHKQLRQIVTAVSDGAIAAVSAEKYIETLRKRG